MLFLCRPVLVFSNSFCRRRCSWLLTCPVPSFQVSDRLGDTGPVSECLASATVSDIAWDAAGCRGATLAFSGQISVGSVCARDAERFIIEGGSEPLFTLRGVRGPPGGGGAAYSLDVALAPVRCTYSKNLAQRVGRMGRYWNKVDGVALTALISRSAASQMDQQRLAALHLARRAIETREAVDLTIDLSLPDLVFPGGGSLMAIRCGRMTAKSIVAPKDAGQGAVDVCEVVWRGCGATACAAGGDWEGVVVRGEGVCVMPEVTVRVEVAADRSDTGVTQLKVEQVVPEVALHVTTDSLKHATCVALEGFWGTADGTEAAMDVGQLSTLVSMGLSFASTAEQGWEYLHRREMAPVRSTGGVRHYADWVRVDYTLRVGRSTASFAESCLGGDKMMVKCVAEGAVAQATVGGPRPWAPPGGTCTRADAYGTFVFCLVRRRMVLDQTNPTGSEP